MSLKFLLKIIASLSDVLYYIYIDVMSAWTEMSKYFLWF